MHDGPVATSLTAMKTSLATRFVAAAALAAALCTATAAQARPDVYFSIGVQNSPVWVDAAPLYRSAPPVYVQPAPVYVQPYWSGYEARRAWERERAWRRAEWLRQQRHEEWRHGDPGYRDHDDRGPRRRHHD